MIRDIGFIRGGLLFALIFSFQALAQGGNAKPGDWQPVEQAIGRSGQMQGDGAYKFSFPRSDMKVTAEGVELKPALALRSGVAFSKPGAGSMVMGDLVLTEDEVTPVMSSLENSGLQVTALHNLVLHESPRVMYMHVGGHGDATKMAASIKQAIASTKIPAPKPPAAPAQDIGIDTKAVEEALGRQGKVNGVVLQFSVPRAESISEGGMKVPGPWEYLRL